MAAAITASPALAEDLSREQIISRSGPICSELLDAIKPHTEKANDAWDKQQWDRFTREGRRAIETARPYGSELRQLLPDTGARKYRRFLNQARKALNLLERALNALEDREMELARSRQALAQEHFTRARRAARRYGLRRSCIKVVS